MSRDDHSYSDVACASLEQKVSWGQERRLQFIDFRLRWEGTLNRTHLKNYFGVSTPQASLDISRYKQLAPQNLDYDGSSKTYVANKGFHACFERSSPQRYLAEALALHQGLLGADTSFIGTPLAVDTVAYPWRTVDDATVESVVHAIRDKLWLKVSYQSMSSADPSWRLLSPHALGFDGLRWHMRAYCQKRKQFADFVLARVLAVEPSGSSDVDFADDHSWHRVVTLVLAPHPGLPVGKRKAIEFDYAMEKGEARLECRQALLYYTLRHLRLESDVGDNAAAQQVILKNRAELQQYIDQ